MILVPRPAPHLPRTLAALRAAGFTDLLPLELSHPEPVKATVPPTATALIFTSPLGIQKGLPRLPAYCVGEATATTARSVGYNVVLTGDNNGHTMAAAMAGHPIQHFAHLHGDHAGMTWHTILTKAGHTVTPVAAYRTHRITRLPQAVTSVQPSITLLFSAGSANHLANLMKHANMPLTGTAIALSPAVAAAACRHWPQVVTAAEPTLAAMVATLSGHPR